MGPNRPRLLIVDDDQDLSLMLSILMKKEGIAGMVAPDGETALRMVSAEMPDMLLVDVKMPGMDGMEVLKQVKENDPDLPVVLITAYAEIRDSVAAMRAGAFDYLPKPFDHPSAPLPGRLARVRAGGGDRHGTGAGGQPEPSAPAALDGPGGRAHGDRIRRPAGAGVPVGQAIPDGPLIPGSRGGGDPPGLERCPAATPGSIYCPAH